MAKMCEGRRLFQRLRKQAEQVQAEQVQVEQVQAEQVQVQAQQQAQIRMSIVYPFSSQWLNAYYPSLLWRIG